jgi:hypothetical protein
MRSAMSRHDNAAAAGWGARARETGIVHELLAYAATQRQGPADRSGFAGWDRADGQLQHVIDAGLAPLLFRAARESNVPIPPVWRETLQGADLSAQVRHGNLIDTANEIIDVCNEKGVTVTLLKGISISDQFYPIAHERPMRDIDILVPQHDCESVESALLLRGYRRSDFDMGEDPYHGPPLRHEGRQVWVEVHSALFPKGAALLRNHLFSPSHIAAQSVASTFHGRPIHRLTDELQLVYIASYWIRDLTGNWIHPSFLPPLFDAVYLLKASGRTLDWDGLLGWLDNEMAAASLYVLLAYICRSGLDSSAARILPRLASRQHIVGPADLRMIFAVLDTYLIRGRPVAGPFSDRRRTIIMRTLEALLASGSHVTKLLRVPWNVAFPPLAADRYHLQFQLDRMTRMLRSIGLGASRE